MGSGFLSDLGSALSGIPIIGPFFDLLSGINTQQQIANLANNIVDLGQHIADILHAVGGFFHTLWGFLKKLWNDYIKKAIQWLADHVKRLREWLKRTIGPIIKRLQKIKKWYDEHILKQQLRMLQTIQTIRNFLGILRLFHVKFAEQLDRKLADIQNRIVTVVDLTRGTLNNIINLLAAVYDPSLLLKRNAISASLLASIGALKRIVNFGNGRPLFASEAADAQAGGNMYLKSTVNSNLAARKSSGLTADDKANRKAAQQSLLDVTSTPVSL